MIALKMKIFGLEGIIIITIKLIKMYKFGVASENEELIIAFAKTVLKKKEWRYAQFFNPLKKRDGNNTDLYFSSGVGSMWSDCPYALEDETYFFSRTNLSPHMRTFHLPEDWNTALEYIDMAFDESKTMEVTYEEAVEIVAAAKDVSVRRVKINPQIVL
jgi:hypothetical protein